MIKVHLTTSRPTLEKDIAILRRVIDVIHANDHFLVHSWVEPAYKRLVELKKPVDDWVYVYKQNLEAVAQADVVIAETTHENFAVGYQVAFAIQQRKPVLMLRREAADKNVFATGVEDGWVRHQEYNDKNVVSIVEKFLKDNNVNSKDMRFNFFLDRKIYNYLRWASFKTGKTKAEILRELVQQEIDKTGL